MTNNRRGSNNREIKRKKGGSNSQQKENTGVSNSQQKGNAGVSNSHIKGNDGGGMEDLAGQESLYICSMELKKTVVSYVIHVIKLSDLLSSSCSCPNPNSTDGDDEAKSRFCRYFSFRDKCPSCYKGSSELHYLVSMASEDLPGFMGCGVFRSQILFAGGVKPCTPPPSWSFLTYPNSFYQRFGPALYEQLHGYDTNQTNTILEVRARDEMSKNLSQKSQPLRFGPPVYKETNGTVEVRALDDMSKNFSPKAQPLLVELKGKLYALSGYFGGECHLNPPYFQVFDPEDKESEWKDLPPPDIFDPDSDHYVGDAVYLSYASMGTKILVSTTPHSPGVLSFDVAKDDPQWETLTAPGPLLSGGPFGFHGTALYVEHDNESFLFTYQYHPHSPSEIVVYLVFNDDSSETITTLQLPVMPIEFDFPYYYKFVHLRGPKVCFIMTSFPLPGYYVCKEVEKMNVVVLTYELSPKMEAVKREVKLVATRFFECDTLRSHNPISHHTHQAHVIGCFVL